MSYLPGAHIHKKPISRALLVVAAAIAALALFSLPSFSLEPEKESGLGPDDVVKQYYQALAEGDVDSACSLRESCPDNIKALVAKAPKILLVDLAVISNDGEKALVYTESLEKRAEGGRLRWVHEWQLEKSGGQWKIIGTDNASYTVEDPETVARQATEIMPTPEGPDQALREFYRALKENDCKRAEELRPGYTSLRCFSIVDAKVNSTETVYHKDRTAVLSISISFRPELENWQDWKGFVTLVHEEDEWIIKNDSFRSNWTLEKYLATFTNEEIKAPDPVPDPKPVSGSLLPPPVPIRDLTFGSQTVLSSCWADTVLAGGPGDKKITHPSQPNSAAQPARPYPARLAGELSPDLRGSIRHVIPGGDRKAIALTFDLCEGANERTGYDAEIVNYLRENNVKATFFAGGKWMLFHPDKAKQLIADPRFEIGNHGWSHEDLRMPNEARMQDQVFWTQVQYEILKDELKTGECAKTLPEEDLDKIPDSIRVFRFPFGTCNAKALEFLAGIGLPAIQWSLVTSDSVKEQSAEKIAAKILAQARPGSIVIMHANGRGRETARALPMFVPELVRKGFEFVTVSELLTLGPAFTAQECYELVPGDNLR